MLAMACKISVMIPSPALTKNIKPAARHHPPRIKPHARPMAPLLRRLSSMQDTNGTIVIHAEYANPKTISKM